MDPDVFQSDIMSSDLMQSPDEMLDDLCEQYDRILTEMINMLHLRLIIHQ